MTAIAFDTLKVVEQLEKAGVPREQAKAQANVLAEVLSDEAGRVANRFATQHDVTQELAAIRADIHLLSKETHADINSLRMEMRALNADTKAELVRWVVAVGVLQMALIDFQQCRRLAVAVGVLQMALIAGLVLKLVH